MKQIARSLVVLLSLIAPACGGGPGAPDAVVTVDGTSQPDGVGAPDGAAGDGAGANDAEPGCTEDCVPGTRTCSAAGGFQVCGQYDLDPCAEPSPTIACAAGFTCTGDRCVPPCRDECPQGETLCAGESTVLSCGNYDADRCLEGGGALACAAGSRCEAGACVPTAAPCTDECTSGQTVCFGDALRTCGQHDSDACLDLSAPVGCGSGQICSAGLCVPYCEDECPASGARECVGDAYRLCGNQDSDACLEWSEPEACAAGASCTAGFCSATCADECDNPGGQTCSPDGSAVSLCGSFDSDACRDRSTPIPCPAGTSCSSGVCLASCVNECVLGVAPACGLDGVSVETCGDYDGDVCTEWGGNVRCPGDATCSGGSCGVPCVDDCTTDGTRECVGATDSWRECGQFDLDSCLDWTAAAACETWEQCGGAGACELGPTPATVLINEVLFDALGSDTAAGNTLFVELWGPPGQGLDGYELVAVDGSGGAITASLSLAGETIAADGYFVIAHPEGAPSVQPPVADITSAFVDLQNGPDSVQVRWRGRVVDALAYGVFSGGQVSAGEGTPASIPGAGNSLTRSAGHDDTGVNGSDFFVPAAPSPRASAGCEHECPTGGATECGGVGGVQIHSCVTNADGDACREWAVFADCATAGEVCLAETGACGVASCTNDCSPLGATVCGGAGGIEVRTCVTDGDADPCLEWSVFGPCPDAGKQCQDGACAIPCADECAAIGATECASTSAARTCGQLDEDGCLEWGSATACPGGQTCIADACQPTSAPDVVLITPQGTVQTTQGNSHRLLADATPAAGRSIAQVEFVVDGAVVATDSAPPYEHYYTIDAGVATDTTLAVQARATDSTGIVGSSPYTYLDVRNDHPVATFIATIAGDGIVNCDASAVTDTETAASALVVCWDWDANGVCDTGWSTAKQAQHDYGASGTFTVGMQVRDAVGQISLATRDVTFAEILYVGGANVTTTTWYGTVVVTGEVVVPAGNTLTIASGTQVLFVFADPPVSDGLGDYTMTINGQLVVQGTAEEPVIFSGFDDTAKAPGGWDRIILAGSGTSTIQHAIIEYADVGLEVRDSSAVSDTVIRSTHGDCLLLSNADGSSYTRLTVTQCGGHGVHATAGSTGVTFETLSSTVNGGSGMRIEGSSTITSCTGARLAGNAGDGATILAGSSLALADSVVETNDGKGLFFRSTAGGTVERCQIRMNAAEGVGLLSDTAGNPMPAVTYSNIYANAAAASRSFSTADPGISASTSYGSSTSGTWTAPGGTYVHRAHVVYSETDYSSNYNTGTLLNGAGTPIGSTFNTAGSAWVYAPEGTTALKVTTSDSYSGYTNSSIVVDQVELIGADGGAEVVAITASGTPSLRYNYLGLFPDVLSRIVLSRTDALDLQGFVGVLFDGTWSRGPYKAGPVDTEAWSGTIYVTGNLTVNAGQTVTVAAGTDVRFVQHDQTLDGEGDFAIVANGRLDAAGASGAPVTFTGYGTPAGTVFQKIQLAGAAAEASLWQHVQVSYGKDAVVVTGGSQLSNVAVTSSARDGVTLLGSSGAILTDVAVTGAARDGIVLQNADGSVLTRVTADSCAGRGLFVGAGSTGVTVSYSTFTGNGGAGVHVDGGSTPAIADSTITYNGAHGVVVTSATTDCDYNTIAHNGGAGLWIEGSGATTAEHNVIKFNDDAGASVWSTSAGSPTPTLQYSNVYGNAVAGSTFATVTTTAISTSTAYGTVQSGTYTAPAGSTIRRARVTYAETDYSSNYDYGRLYTAGGAQLGSDFSTSTDTWVHVPAGTTSLYLWATDSYSGYTSCSIALAEVDLVSTSATTFYELVVATDTGTTTAKFDYWGTIGDVASKIFQLRGGSVDYTGYRNAYAEGTEVGPRP